MIAAHFRKSFYIISACCLIAIIGLSVVYLNKILHINNHYEKRYDSSSLVAIRKFPYPYKAALAISNDPDNTETLEEFLEIHRFLNTRSMTSLGVGVGLEVGSGFLFYEPPESAISYFSGEQKVATTIIRFIKAGYIDFLHSYGKKPNFTREDAIAALQELNANECKVDVWIDHTRSIDNLGDYRTSGKGDHPKSTAYHADLTISHGIKFVWLGRVTMITGQSVAINLRTFTGIFDPKHPFLSFINIGKELAKNVIAAFGNKKYAIHKENDLLKISTLDDGQKVYEFIRFDNYWKGVGTGADAKGLAYSISKKTLNQLKRNGGYMIVYTHLGRNSDRSQYIPSETREALRNLANEYQTGNIYVTSTSKLLNYYVRHKYLNWTYETRNEEIIIHIHSIKDPIYKETFPTLKDLQGITFYVPDNKKTLILIDGEELEEMQRNPRDHTGRVSVTIPMQFLNFPLNENSS